ncbi:MAG: DUF1674 domain-containing protein [Rhodospirillales bacterium]|nr:DUF1674 domain-containing protein [Rhodospirillales bacterium]
MTKPHVPVSPPPAGRLSRAQRQLDHPTAAAGQTSSAPIRQPEAKPAPETGGPEGPDPTRFGDWERKGRCIDF